MELAVIIVSGIAGAVSFLNTFVTNRRLRIGLRKAKEESEKTNVQLEKLANALGIMSDEEDNGMHERSSTREPYMESPNSEHSVISIKCKYDKKTKEIIVDDTVFE